MLSSWIRNITVNYLNVLLAFDSYGRTIQWVPGALSLGIKRPWREADHSTPSSAEVKE
jgi:hypothetical protein